MHLTRINILPERYKKASLFMYILNETILVVIILEISVNLIWKRVQIGIECLMKLLLLDNTLHLYKEMGGDSLLGFIIACLTVYFVCYSISITISKQNMGHMLDGVIGKFHKTEERNVACCVPSEICKPQQNSTGYDVKEPVNLNGTRLIKPAAH